MFSSVALHLFFLFFFSERGSLVGLEPMNSDRLANKPTLGPFCLCPVSLPSVMTTGIHCHIQFFSIWMLDIELRFSRFPFHTSTSLAEPHLPSLARSLWNLDSGITKTKKKGEGEVRSITLLEGIWGVGQEVSRLLI